MSFRLTEREILLALRNLAEPQRHEWHRWECHEAAKQHLREGLLADQAARRVIEAALHQLKCENDEHFLLLHERFWQGKTVAAVGHRLGKSMSGVHSRQRSAVARLTQLVNASHAASAERLEAAAAESVDVRHADHKRRSRAVLPVVVVATIVLLVASRPGLDPPPLTSSSTTATPRAASSSATASRQTTGIVPTSRPMPDASADHLTPTATTTPGDLVPSPAAPAPEVLSGRLSVVTPPNGNHVAGLVPFSWSWDGSLGAGEVFDVLICPGETCQPVRGQTNTTALHWRWCPNHGTGAYRWYVAVIDGTTKQQLGPRSDVFSFVWTGGTCGAQAQTDSGSASGASRDEPREDNAKPPMPTVSP